MRSWVGEGVAVAMVSVAGVGDVVGVVAEPPVREAEGEEAMVGKLLDYQVCGKSACAFG